MKRTITLLLSIACIGVSAQLSALEVGKPSPEFTGTDDLGNAVSLSDFKGSYVVLEWLNYGCPFVKKHYNSHNMQNLQKKMVDNGVVWLSIVSSAKGKQGYMTPEESREAYKNHDSHASKVLLDPKGTIGRLYGAKTTPHMFLISPEGELIYQGAIDSISSTNPDDIEQAVNYVKQAWKAHMKGEKVDPVSTRAYGCSVKYG